MSKTDDDLAELAAYSGDPWTSDNPYFARAEAYMEQSWNELIWPVIHGLDLRSVLDLAAGHGRNSQRLLDHCETLTIMDIQPDNIERCRQRFAGIDRITYHVTNGYDLRPVADGSITLVYCFDAMVHFDSDVVRSYLADTYRVLAPGAHAFFHHSNYTGGDDWRAAPAARAFMSRELFAHYARKEGFDLVSQRVIDWDSKPNLDCLSLIRKHGP
jgi:SAM-dependent methyltransferase